MRRRSWPTAIDERTAVVMLTHVNYRTGYLHDMRELTAQTHAQGALAIWDLAHSAGAVPVDLNEADADFAVGCTYKYLNGGPGAPAFFVGGAAPSARFPQPLSGWWGHAAPFAMQPEFRAGRRYRQRAVRHAADRFAGAGRMRPGYFPAAPRWRRCAPSRWP